ncbi:MAG TPA: molybdopterin converting factor subunit 1 [Candidatus Acidoferrales bacterium]|nr:molybdopterin converting factor subunit 1 [Candidatus Acidoferrales bacterium]
MTIRVLFFASLRERLRRSEDRCSLAEGATVDDLWEVLCQQYPQLIPLARSIRFAVNREYVKASQALADNDEVALIPPVSGG